MAVFVYSISINRRASSSQWFSSTLGCRAMVLKLIHAIALWAAEPYVLLLSTYNVFTFKIC